MTNSSSGNQSSEIDVGFSCLLVEDDDAFAILVSRVVQSIGGRTVRCGTLMEATAAAMECGFDLVLLDNHLPDGKAYDFFSGLSRRNPDAPVIMITGLPDLSEALSLTRNGLFDYLTKPVDVDELTECLNRAKLRMRRKSGEDWSGGECIGESPVMRGVMEQLRQAARHRTATVLLTGESGVGKDVAARALHRLTFEGTAEKTPFVAINCAAVPGEMFEAELFGAERGAYTGADKRRTGLAEAARDGTLFLDEIGDVPTAMQAKLLRLLEGREFRPLGGTTEMRFNGRFVSATNRSLKAEVAAGRFREDLLYRVEVFSIEIPPLRERKDDVPQLAEHLLRQLASRYDRPAPLLRPDDIELLQGFDFPGNVRELRNILERALLRTADDTKWLAIDRVWLETSAGPTRAPSACPSPGPAAPDHFKLPPERVDLTPLESQEYLLIRKALVECSGGIRRTAAEVGLSPQALLRRLEKWPELRNPAR